MIFAKRWQWQWKRPFAVNNGKPSSIYGKLVESKDDFLGIFAYSVYKRQKTELVASLADAEDNVFQLQLKQFTELCNSETQLNYFRTEADQLALNFTTAALNEQIEEIQKAYDDRLTAEIRSINPSFWFGVWSSVVGSIIFVLFPGIIVFFCGALLRDRNRQ
jgi:hypothetical protein